MKGRHLLRRNAPTRNCTTKIVVVLMQVCQIETAGYYRTARLQTGIPAATNKELNVPDGRFRRVFSVTARIRDD